MAKDNSIIKRFLSLQAFEVLIFVIMITLFALCLTTAPLIINKV